MDLNISGFFPLLFIILCIFPPPNNSLDLQAMYFKKHSALLLEYQNNQKE